MEDGVKGYFDFISTKRYANLKSASTPKEYLELIKKDGYATSSSYVNTNMSCITKYDLDKYDWNNVQSVSNPYVLSDSIIKKGSKGESVKWLQYELNKRGYKLSVDGDFGTKTEAAVKDFQSKNKLVVDGIVGKNTIRSLTNG
jgi:lysozyme family protein